MRSLALTDERMHETFDHEKHIAEREICRSRTALRRNHPKVEDLLALVAAVDQDMAATKQQLREGGPIWSTATE